MRRSWMTALAVFTLGAPMAAAQRPTIEIRKVRTLVDQDGKAFVRPPMLFASLPRGRYALEEVNALPVIVDSTGRLIKQFGRGGGPGEFGYNATSLTAIGDTLYAGNGQKFNLYDADLGFIGAIPLTSVRAGPIARTPEGFVMYSQKSESRSVLTWVHVIRPSGDVLRSFVSDTIRRPRYPTGYRLAMASDGDVWVLSSGSHRIDKWSVDGKRVTTLAKAPAWFDTTRQVSDGTFWVRSAREADGILWVMSSVPVPNYRQILARALEGVSGEVDARKIPEELLSTSRLEAYDARSGKMLADLSINSYGVGILDDRQFVVYTTGPNDEAQLEIWEMRLRR